MKELAMSSMVKDRKKTKTKTTTKKNLPNYYFLTSFLKNFMPIRAKIKKTENMVINAPVMEDTFHRLFCLLI